MGWLENIQAAPDTGVPAVVAADGRVYTQVFQVEGRTDAHDEQRTLIGYAGAAAGAKPGEKATLYDLSGRPNGEFVIEDTTRDPIGKLILAGILAMTAGAAAYGAGLFGGGAAGASAAGTGAVELGTATGADLSAFYGGLDGAPTLGGGATLEGATVAATAATTAGSTATTAATTAATAARAGGSLLTTIAGAASSALGVAASALGVRNAAAGTHPPAVSSSGAPVAVSGQGGGPDWPTFLFLGGAAAAVVWVFVQSKG